MPWTLKLAARTFWTKPHSTGLRPSSSAWEERFACPVSAAPSRHRPARTGDSRVPCPPPPGDSFSFLGEVHDGLLGVWPLQMSLAAVAEAMKPWLEPSSSPTAPARLGALLLCCCPHPASPNAPAQVQQVTRSHSICLNTLEGGHCAR